MIQEEDMMKMKNSIDKQNMNLSYKENKQFRFCIKFVLSSLISITIFTIVTISIKYKNRELIVKMKKCF